ncbi:hypothetical protein [Rhodococcus sp. UFZ-B548]|uniref:hypothetical protein n=1 Tax=Rhodococcus sp. UFZ-B548 TaxID=2742212 RepID=UPI0015F716F4|nr:hypothetical protein [Rhodococcus sp. UFZ-B548]
MASDANKLLLGVIGLSLGSANDFSSFSAEEHPFVGVMSRVLEHVNRTSSDIPFLRRLRENRADLQYEKDIECVWPVVNNDIAEPLAEDDSSDLMFNNTDNETGEKLNR